LGCFDALHSHFGSSTITKPVRYSRFDVQRFSHHL